ncbi:efflux RND transporter permease subunit [Sphingobacterium haloxyli]|uniref:Multidrug efflux pump protein n=1 Tax=Sphingobacterium haloxyli TaxID=2100533 RepID=A0A2S9J000_9SPHI|nr:efflux RND transporter permease subunit [Sphingobacterium haloxyli]PRD46105.1 multidrug efflux pump protein [Sphingobacterium haloxyli]
MGKQQTISSFSVILVFACLSLIGLALVPLLPIKLAPSQTLPNIGVHFSMYGSSPRTVELEATSRLEAMLNRIDGIKKISSKSGNGWGRIQVEFNKHTDIDVARFEISTIIRQTWSMLPENVSYPSISQSKADKNANKSILAYTINAPAAPYEIQDFAEKSIKSQLALIEGVYQVDVRGAVPMVWRLEYDADVLRKYDVTVREIQRTLSEVTQVEFLDMAMVETPSRKKEWIQITARSAHTSISDAFMHIGVRRGDGTIIPLEKLLRVNRVEEQAQSYFRINGLNSIYLTIVADEWSNQLALGKKIKQELNDVRKMLPAGYELHLNYDATEFIQKELDKIYFRTSLTLAILLSFMLLTYRNLKYVLLTVISLFSNLTIAAILYYLLELEIQLYSLAGITISLTLIIDNTIVMAEHITRKNNLRAFMSIMAATVTTIGTLTVVFLMDERVRLNLFDFAMVMMVNLGISLFIALFLVPALLDKLKLERPKQKAGDQPIIRRRKRLRFSIYFYRYYGVLCRFLYRWRAIVIALLILAFGLPVFLLPEKIEKDTKWASWYNGTLGSAFYKETVAPYVNYTFGGTLRLFVQKVKHGTYFTDREETSLQVNASLPSNSTIEEMNGLVQQMESYISQFPEVRQFQTDIHSAQQASISIQFVEEHANGGFPYLLKSRLITKSLELGGGSWGVYGLGDGFSNDVREGAGSYRVEMFGYNYDELLHWAEQFKQKLLEHRRIREVFVNAEFSWFKDDYEEFAFILKKDRLIEENIQPYQLYEQLNTVLGNRINAGNLPTPEGSIDRVFLHAKQADDYAIWDMLHIPIHINDHDYKLSELASIDKMQMPKEVGKVNQQFRLCLQYEYIGAHEQGRKVQEHNIEEFAEGLPLGYTIKDANPRYGGNNKKQDYFLLIYVFIVIYLVCSVLFNSFRKPLYIVFVIPISFIGIFLSFYFFSIEFDQGGYASFILLAALTINANIYIVEEYSHLVSVRSGLSPLRAYLKACQAKIRPILLTVLSTILGFVPFLIGDGKEAFWFPLAVGTMGGLTISTVATLLFLPLFMGVGKGGTKID